jgi:transcriptional regulator with XRE-family HTH domain
MNSYWTLLAKKRKALGKSQTDFAAALSYSVQAIAKYEKGQAEMNVTVLLKTARFLEVDPDSLLAGVDAKNNDIADTTEFDEKRFVTNWRNARLQKGLSQETLAKAIGMTPRSLKNYERGSSRPSFSTFAGYLKAVGMSASTFLSQDLKSSAPLPQPKKGFPRYWILPLVFLVILGGTGAGLGVVLYQKHQATSSLSQTSSAFSSLPVTSSSNASSNAPSPSSSAEDSSTNGSSSSSSSVATTSTATSATTSATSSVSSSAGDSSTNGASSSSSSVSNNGEVGVAFLKTPLYSGMESSLQVFNYTCDTNAIQPAVAFSSDGSLPSHFYCASNAFYLPYEQGAGTLFACLYDYQTNQCFTTPISEKVLSGDVPTNLDAAIAECQSHASSDSDMANAYQTNVASPAGEAFRTLRDYGASQGYVILSGATYTFTSSASDAYRKDLLAAESKEIGTSMIVDNYSLLANGYSSDVTYLTKLKY